jgi:diazepam-binding inhibitor (GABA receptor modulating acyl-CoA-binding protein)
MSTLQQDFAAAAEQAKQLPKRPDNQTLLKLYALYKQATAGDVTGTRPGGFDFAGAAKYDAWAALQGTAQDEAQRAYVALVKQLQG